MHLDTKLKPFIPSYIPAIGEVDAFLKINRPDNLPEELGLTVIDEPNPNGIDPRIFSLELSYKFKTPGNSNFTVTSIPDAEKNPKEIQNWIDQISNLHKEKMSSTVSYSKNMPDIESLMQVWPEQVETGLKEIKFPSDKLKISTQDYAKLVCNMLDIPIHKLNNQKALIEALHVLFTLYSEFKENPHFNETINNVPSKPKKENIQSMMFE